MGGDNTQTTTSGLNNSELNSAVSTIGSQLNTQLGQGFKGYSGNLVPDMSAPTSAAISGLSNNPNTSIFSSGVSGALGQQAKIAQGEFGDDPVRQRLMEDVGQNVNSGFLTSGRFGSMGSGAHSDTLARETAGALAPYDMARQQQAIGNMGSLYSMSGMPAAAQMQAGQFMDQYNAAKAAEAERQFNVANNAGWETLRQAGGILGTTAPSAGTTTTSSQNVPWWQTGLGIGAGIMSFL